ncbi:MAG: pyridoxal phosphate-dependent aminotransferase [Candidatus Wallbacteria bacterium]|nr:pyridoxal phosphate-dependent aminotransferase [Candidatus Wallbacteria bacterium]
MMEKHLISARLRAVKPSATVALSDRARTLAASGRDIISLSAGEPDFDTPAHVIRAASDAMASGFTHYTNAAGIPELREAIAEKLARENGLRVDPGREVLVLPGAKQGVAYACLAFLDDGDECLCPEPSWVSFRELVTLAGGRYIPVATRAENDFRLASGELERHVTSKSRMIILNSPTNPTGKVWSAEELEEVARVARKHDLIVLVDEIYEKILYDGRKHVSLAGLPGMAERCLTLNGFSKAFAMTGWRLGYLAGPARLIEPLLMLQQHTATCAVSFAQKGAVAALRGDSRAQDAMVEAFVRRRALLMDKLSGVPGLSVWKPEGTFYMFLDVRGSGRSSLEVSEHLLENEGLAMTPGDAFGECGQGFIRLSFAASEKTLIEAARRIDSGLRKLTGTRG